MTSGIKNLLIFNLATDVDDRNLSFTTAWIASLAKRVEHIYVISMRVGTIDLPANVKVFSVGHERGYGKLHRLFRFWRLLGGVLKNYPVDACFSHMMPIFSTLGCLLLRAYRVPLVTWYSHPKRNLWVKCAALVSDRLVTSLPSAFGGIRCAKLAMIGQGIDVDLFCPDRSVTREKFILCAGRISRVKRLETLISAFILIHRDYDPSIKLVIVGPTISDDDRCYREELGVQMARFGVESSVEIIEGVVRAELPALYRRAHVHVNLTPPGFADKVALEAMSCGTPSLMANTDLRETLGTFQDILLFRVDDPEGLAKKIIHILDLPAERYALLSAYVREQINVHHCLDTLCSRVATILSDLRAN
jgi:glycosyltransferase involved in cell wall biosynthesis